MAGSTRTTTRRRLLATGGVGLTTLGSIEAQGATLRHRSKRRAAADGASFEPVLDPNSGPPGTAFVASGAVPLTGEDGKPVQVADVVIWWNLDPNYPSQDVPHPVAAGPGPFEALDTVPIQNGQDAYQASVVVPVADPGSYPVVVTEETTDGSVGNVGTALFTVTA